MIGLSGCAYQSPYTMFDENLDKAIYQQHRDLKEGYDSRIQINDMYEIRMYRRIQDGK